MYLSERQRKRRRASGVADSSQCKEKNRTGVSGAGAELVVRQSRHRSRRRSKKIEIEDVSRLVVKVVADLAALGSGNGRGQKRGEDAVAQFDSHLDTINAPAFHRIVRGLACVSNSLSGDHLEFVARQKPKQRLQLSKRGGWR